MKCDVKMFSYAVAFAAAKHAGQTRFDGSPYIYHPMTVASMVKNAGFGLKYQIAAVLHDTLEDTDATEDELREGFGDEVTDAVVLLTRAKGEDEEEYVAKLLRNHISAVVKNADKIHNLCELAFTGEPGETRSEEAQAHACRYINKALKYYQNRFSQALNSAIARADAYLVSEIQDRKYSVCDYSADEMQLFSDHKVDPMLQSEMPDFSLPYGSAPDGKIIFLSLDGCSFEDPEIYCLYDFSIPANYTKGWKLTHNGWVMEDKRSGDFQLSKLVDFDDDTYSPEEMISYLKELKYNYHYFVEGAKLGVDI